MMLCVIIKRIIAYNILCNLHKCGIDIFDNILDTAYIYVSEEGSLLITVIFIVDIDK